MAMAAVVAALVAGCVSLPSRPGPGESANAARHLVDRHSDAVVTVLGTLRVSTNLRGLELNEQRDMQVEAPGTVIDPSGVVIAGTLLLDPVGSLVHSPLQIREGPDAMKLEVASTLQRLRILRADGTEVPARVLLRDDDLGLFVLAPTPGEHPQPFAALPPTHGADLELYQELIVLGRAPDTLSRTPLIGRGWPVARLTQPRACHALMTSMMPAGMPVFDAEGRLVAIGGLLFRKPGADHHEPEQGERPLPVLLPLADLRALLARALPTYAQASIPPPAAAAAAPAAGMTDARARELIAACRKAIVSIRGSVTFTEGADTGESEEVIDTVGTVVDRSGLVVADGTGRRADRLYRLQRLVYVLDDGTEVPAQVVSQDDERGLTVFAPLPGYRRPALHFLPPGEDPTAGLFDEVLVASRLDRRLRNEAIADPARIVGVQTKPQLRYLADGLTGGPAARGGAAILSDGRLLGVLVAAPAAGRATRPIIGVPQTDLLALDHLAHIVPAAAVAETLARARAVGAGK